MSKIHNKFVSLSVTKTYCGPNGGIGCELGRGEGSVRIKISKMTHTIPTGSASVGANPQGTSPSQGKIPERFSCHVHSSPG